MLVELEQLDWLWSVGKVSKVMMDLLYLTERYKHEYGELVIVQAETFTEQGLQQSVTLCGLLSSKRATA